MKKVFLIAGGISIIILALIAYFLIKNNRQITEAPTPTGPAELVERTVPASESIDPDEEKKEFIFATPQNTLRYYKPAGHGLFELDLTSKTETKLTQNSIDLIDSLRWSVSGKKALIQVNNEIQTLRTSAPKLIENNPPDGSQTWWEYDIEADSLLSYSQDTIDAIYSNETPFLLNQTANQFQIINGATKDVQFTTKAINVKQLLSVSQDGNDFYGLATTSQGSFLVKMNKTNQKSLVILNNIALRPLISPNLSRAIIQTASKDDEATVSLHYFDLSQKLSQDLGIVTSKNRLDKIVWTRDSNNFYIAYPSPAEEVPGDILVKYSAPDLAVSTIETGLTVDVGHLTLDEGSNYIYTTAKDRIYRIPIGL